MSTKAFTNDVGKVALRLTVSQRAVLVRVVDRKRNREGLRDIGAETTRIDVRAKDGEVNRAVGRVVALIGNGAVRAGRVVARIERGVA